MKSAISRWLIAVLLALLVMCPHIRMYSNEKTRYFAFWDYTDALAIELIVLAGGSLLFAGHQLFRRLQNRTADRIERAGFVLLFGFALLSNFDIAQIGYMQLAWSLLGYALSAGIVIAAMISASKRCTWISRWCATCCLILSPVVPMIFLELLWYPTYTVQREVLPVAEDATNAVQPKGDVYVFVFDAWSYQQSIGRDDFETDLPNLAAFVQSATTYHNAHSLFAETYQSLPSILFQTNDRYEAFEGRVHFRNADGRLTDAQTVEGLFDRARHEGFQTYMVGWSHPYRPMLGDSVDFAYSGASQGSNPNARRIDHSVMRHLRMGLSKFALSIPKPLAAQWPLNAICDMHDGADVAVDRVNSIHNLATTIAKQPGRPRLAVFHYPIPHGPYVFNRNGFDPSLPANLPLTHESTTAGLLRPDPKNHIARYRGNLRYMDTLLGEFVETLKRAGSYERATIVLTSDHSWRVDPAFDQLCIEHNMTLGGITKVNPPLKQLTHVPLIVKAPHQSGQESIDKSIRLTQLNAIIRGCKNASKIPTMARQGVQALPIRSTSQ